MLNRLHRCLLVFVILWIGGCVDVTYEKQGSFVHSADESENYGLAVISPASHRFVRPTIESALIDKGYIVVPHTYYDAIHARIAHQKTLVIQCSVARPSRRLAFGLSWKVTCTGVDFNSGDLVYDGRGEHMGLRSFDGINGAIMAALENIPQTGGSGRMIALHESTNFFSKSGRRRTRDRNDSASDEFVHSGTGFFVTGDGHLVTNAHVVAHCRQVAVHQPSGPLFNATLIAQDANNDLAVLRVTAPGVAFAHFNTRTTQGQYAATYGYPLAGLLSESGAFTDGRISALFGLRNNTNHLQISVPVQPGNSGGPLVDDRGNVIGVVTEKLNALKVAGLTGDIAQNVSFAIKAQMVTAFLDLHGVDYSAEPNDEDLNATALVERLKEFIVKVYCQRK